jgi:hypothetical protein
MGFIADFKARRAAKRAQAQFELETYSMAIRVRSFKYRSRYLYQRSKRR